jgi:hypothetical protein
MCQPDRAIFTAYLLWKLLFICYGNKINLYVMLLLKHFYAKTMTFMFL